MLSHQSDLLLRATVLGILISAGGTAHAASVTVNFDTLPDGSLLTAPNSFAAATRLTELFAADGVHCQGGGAVLSNPGQFGVSGTSGSNFLAFNVFATYTDGTRAAPPETILFDKPCNMVQL